jgi:glycosyltransferase involved in cell wall biosynthesis
VLFQGTLSLNNCPFEIIQSMPWWPPDAGIVFLGPSPPEYRTSLLECAAELRLSDRVLFLERVAYQDLFRYTVDADICLTISRPTTPTWKYNAGASNKRFEAIACGVPQITNWGPGLSTLIEGNGVGKCIKSLSPDAIGKAVADLLSDPSMRSEMSRRARDLHLRLLNYETEFQPILDFIMGILAKTRGED